MTSPLRQIKHPEARATQSQVVRRLVRLIGIGALCGAPVTVLGATIPLSGSSEAGAVTPAPCGAQGAFSAGGVGLLHLHEPRRGDLLGATRCRCGLDCGDRWCWRCWRQCRISGLVEAAVPAAQERK